MLKQGSFDFKGKVAVVTGGSKGVGRAVAKALHEAGATVYTLARSADLLETLASECPGIRTLVCDLSDWKTTRKIVEDIPEDRIDFLVNNAALLKQGSFMTLKPEDFDAHYQLNLKSVVNVSQVVAKKMIANGGGSILNVSSVAAIKPGPPLCAYCVFKAALDHLTKNMAMELGPLNIRVNSINPGFIETDMLDQCYDAFGTAMNVSDSDKLVESLHQMVPFPQKVVSMEELVSTILFMVSNTAPMMHGSIVSIDGGMSL